MKVFFSTIYSTLFFCVFLQVNRYFVGIGEYGMLHLYYRKSVNKLYTG